MSDTQTRSPRSSTTRAMVTINVALLVALVFRWTPSAPADQPSSAKARQYAGQINPADQRREIIQNLEQISAKLDTLNQKLSKPLEVKVVQMPAAAQPSAQAPASTQSSPEDTGH